MKEIIIIGVTVIAIAAIGFFLGLALGFAGKIFGVKKDEKTQKLKELLPNANCGGCGYAGCEAYADAVANHGEAVNKCTVASEEALKNIAELMGEDITPMRRMRAQVMCSGTKTLSRSKYEYRGIEDCISVARLGNGPKECKYGCIGLGTCVKACPFGAIKLKNGVAVVEYSKCMACGVCVDACPRHIIKLVPFDSEMWVGCSSGDKGAAIRKYCNIGCIGCGKCKKECPVDAISLSGNVAEIDYDKCISCGRCAEVCPSGVVFSGKPAAKAEEIQDDGE